MLDFNRGFSLEPSNRNKLNNLSPKEWTKHSASVLAHNSIAELIGFLTSIYSKNKERNFIINDSDVIKPSNFATKQTIDLVIVNLSNLTSLSQYKKGIKCYIKYLGSIILNLNPKRYLVVIVRNFADETHQIQYFPTHTFITQISGETGFQQSDLWIDENLDVIILCFKINKDEKVDPLFKLDITDLQKYFSPSEKRITKDFQVIQGFSSPREPEYIKHGATFPQSLVEYLIDSFTQRNDTVLDIFAGVGVTLLAAKAKERNCIGIELNPKYIKWNQDVLGRKSEGINEKYLSYMLINDDSRNLDQIVPKKSVDLMITSPPYFNILHKVSREANKRGRESVFRRRKMREKITDKDLPPQDHSFIPHPYSGDEKDLGNIESYDIFLKEISILHKKVLEVLKPEGFAIWIVRDFRNMKRRIPYVSFHSDLAISGIQNGYILQDMLIWKQNRERSLIHLGGGYSYYNSITHSFIIILRKPIENMP